MSTTGLPDRRPLEDCALAILLDRAPVEDQVQLFHLLERGIPVENAARALTASGLINNQQVVARILGITSSTLKRRAKDPQKVLNSHRSTCLFFFLKVLARAEVVFGTNQAAQRWMAVPALGLDGYVPIDLVINPFGYEIVSSFLTSLEHGTYQ